MVRFTVYTYLPRKYIELFKNAPLTEFENVGLVFGVDVLMTELFESNDVTIIVGFSPSKKSKMTSGCFVLACVAWRFLRNLSAPRTRRSRDNERQSDEAERSLGERRLHRFVR